MNLYGYVGNSPTTSIDPLGLTGLNEWNQMSDILTQMRAAEGAMGQYVPGSAAWIAIYRSHQVLAQQLGELLLKPPVPSGNAGFACPRALGGVVAVSAAGYVGWKAGTYLQGIRTSPATTYGDDFANTWGISWLAGKTSAWGVE